MKRLYSILDQLEKAGGTYHQTIDDKGEVKKRVTVLYGNIDDVKANPNYRRALERALKRSETEGNGGKDIIFTPLFPG